MTLTSPEIVFVSDDAGSNSLGRVYCLWLLAEELGLSSLVVAAQGDAIWEPLRGSKFSEAVRTGLRLEDAYALSPRVLICVKPLPAAFDLAERWARDCAVPLVLDIDDPDIEAGLADGNLIKKIAKAILRPRQTAAFRRARRRAPSLPVIVSNPHLEATYGGTVIPHVRPVFEPGPPPVSESPLIAFVGTSRRHKGLELLRSAVERSQTHGYRLLITDAAPEDARPWEDWVGRTSIEEGLELVRRADVVVIPSSDTVFSRGQLPAKLIDAMMAGRAIAASDLPTTRWAVGDGGILFEPGSLDSLVSALSQLADPNVRRQLGNSSRRRAISEFSIASNASKLQAVLAAVRDSAGA